MRQTYDMMASFNIKMTYGSTCGQRVAGVWLFPTCWYGVYQIEFSHKHVRAEQRKFQSGVQENTKPHDLVHSVYFL